MLHDVTDAYQAYIQRKIYLLHLEFGSWLRPRTVSRLCARFARHKIIKSLCSALRAKLRPELSLFSIAWEKSAYIWWRYHWLIPHQMMSEKRAVVIPCWWRVTNQIWVVLLIGWIKFPTWHGQSEALPRSGERHIISMEFLRLFLRRHLAGKPVVALPNVGYFLRLI